MEKRPRIEDHGVEGKDQIFHLDKKIDCVFARIRDIPEGCRYFTDTSKASLNEAFVALSLCFRTKAKSFPYMVLGYLIETDPRPYLLKLFRKLRFVSINYEDNERMIGFDQIIIESTDRFSNHHSNLGMGLRTQPFGTVGPIIHGFEWPWFMINTSANGGPDGFITKKKLHVRYSLFLEDENHDPLFDEDTVKAIQYSLNLTNILDESFLSNFKKRFGMHRLPYAMFASMVGFVNSFYMMNRITSNWKIDPMNDDFCLHHIAISTSFLNVERRRPSYEIFAVGEFVPYGKENENLIVEVFDALCSFRQDPGTPYSYLDCHILNILHELFDILDSITSFDCKRDIIIKFLDVVIHFEQYPEESIIDVFEMISFPESYNGLKLLLFSVADKLFKDANHKGLANFERLLSWASSDDMNDVREDMLVRVILDGTVPLWTLPSVSELDRELLDKVFFRVRQHKVDHEKVAVFLQCV